MNQITHSQILSCLGLAGIYYGFEQITPQWLEQIARKNDIIDLASRLATAINQKP